MPAAGNAECAQPERPSLRAARLTCSIAALMLACLVLAAAVITSFFTVVTMRGGSAVPGHIALFLVAAGSLVLAVLSALMLQRDRATALAPWMVPTVLACFAALSCVPYARGAVLLGYTAVAANMPVYLAAALVAILGLTQIAARLARRSACSCN